jgi:hypothetical protein
MKESVRYRLWELRTAWIACILLPLPAMLFWHSHDGRSVALWCFCLGCFVLVASTFRRCFNSVPPRCSWQDCVFTAALALSAAWALFSLLWLALVDRHDFVALFIAFQILIPALCVVPCVTLITRKVFSAVVLSAFLLGCMKFVAGIVVNLVYGWGDSHQDGTPASHELPWTNPNLMLSAFWIAAATLSISLYFLGARRFKTEPCRSGQRLN